MVREATATTGYSAIILSPSSRNMEPSIFIVCESVDIQVTGRTDSASVGCIRAACRGPATDIRPDTIVVLGKLAGSVSGHSGPIDKLEFVIRRY